MVGRALSSVANQFSYLPSATPLTPLFQVRPRALGKRTVPHRGAGDAWRAHQPSQRLRVLCRETKGLESLDLCIARAGAGGGWQGQAREVRRHGNRSGGCGRGDTTQRQSVRRSERCTQVEERASAIEKVLCTAYTRGSLRRQEQFLVRKRLGRCEPWRRLRPPQSDPARPKHSPWPVEREVGAR